MGDPEKPGEGSRFFLDSLGGSLSDAEISLADLIEEAPDAIVLIDSQNVVRYWSAGAERMFQHRREDVVGRKVGFIVPADLLESDELGWLQRRIQEGGTVTNHLSRRVRKDGVELSVSITRSMLHDARGRPIGSTAIIRDISDQKRREEELGHARRMAMMGEMAATVAHEVRNPLATIHGTVQLLERRLGGRLEPDDPARRSFDRIQGEIRRVDEIVEDLLRFARPGPPQTARRRIDGLIRDLLESLEGQADLARHEVSVEVEEGLCATLDDRLIGQVLANLVLNAAQAMPERGAIRVAASCRGDRVVIEVSDSGPGIEPEVLSRVFDPFFTTKRRGTGLGLAIARRNVESHGGEIRVESRPGGGTSFRVELPRST